MNAFNMARRDELLHLIQKISPELFPFLQQCYGRPSNLIYGDFVILSQRGIQQGDPLGPDLFCLLIDALVKSLKSEFNVWYLDDGTIGDTPDIVLSDFQRIIEVAATLGLLINPNKCELSFLGPIDEKQKQAILSKFRNLAPGIQLINDNDAFLLGSPLNDASIPKNLNSKIENLKKFSHRLTKLSGHSGYFLLKHSFSTPRLVYFLRSSPTWRYPQLLEDYDAVLKVSLETLTNSTLDINSWLQSSLPVKLGGLGIRHAIDLCLPSFMASFHNVLPIVSSLLPMNFQDLVEEEGLSLWINKYEQEPPPIISQGLQKFWEYPIFKNIQETIFKSTVTLEDKARILAAQEPKAGCWLDVIPSPSLGTHLDDDSFRIACALRLGTSICHPHSCISCGKAVDKFGRHGLSCTMSSGRHSRLSICNDIIKRSLHSAGYPSLIEPAGLSRSDGKRPDGMTQIPWSRGKSLIWDFTCTDTFAAYYISETSLKPGAAAKRAETRKLKV